MTTGIDRIVRTAPISRHLQSFFWLHPEWWAMILCGVGWCVMAQHAWRFAAHGPHHRMTLPQDLAYWMLMVCAMMLPLLIDPIRAAANRSLWARRHRSIAGFLFGYFAVWFVAGTAASWIHQWPRTQTYAATAILFAAAAIWEVIPRHAVLLSACHRPPLLAPNGWQADRDAVFYGCQISAPCVLTCGPLMLACMFSGHLPVAMIGGMLIGIIERSSYRPRTSAAAIGAVFLAAFYGAWSP